MEHRWVYKGQVLFSTGFLIDPDGAKYVGYKVIPRHGNRSMRKKPKIELCSGSLHRCYSEEDSYIMLRTKSIKVNEYHTDRAALESIKKYFNAKLLDGWIILKPTYPHTMLNMPWKNMRQVRISLVGS